MKLRIDSMKKIIFGSRVFVWNPAFNSTMQNFLSPPSPQNFRKTLRLRHYEKADPVKPIAKEQLDALTSHSLLSNVFYLHNISKNIFVLQPIIALPSFKFVDFDGNLNILIPLCRLQEPHPTT